MILSVFILLVFTRTAFQKKGTITFSFTGGSYIAVGSYIYGPDGKRASSYRGGKPYFKRKTTLTYYGPIRWIKHQPYYSIGHWGYIRAQEVVVLDHKNTFVLRRNSYVYNQAGKRLKYFRNSQRPVVLDHRIPVHFVCKGEPTQANKKYFYILDEFNKPRGDTSDKHWLPYRKINGCYYYYLGHGGYIKAYNVLFINGWFNYSNGAKVKIAKWGDVKFAVAVNQHEQDQKSPKFRRGSTVTVDASKWLSTYSNGSQYYRIKGTKDTFIGRDDLASNPEKKRALTQLPSN